MPAITSRPVPISERLASAAGDAVADARVPGLHGFPLDRDAMRASLILTGPAVRAGKIEGAHMVDVAPTVARWLGLALEKGRRQTARAYLTGE